MGKRSVQEGPEDDENGENGARVRVKEEVVGGLGEMEIPRRPLAPRQLGDVITLSDSDDNEDQPPSTKPYCISRIGFKATEPQHLEFEPGQVILREKKLDDGYAEGICKGRRGIFLLSFTHVCRDLFSAEATVKEEPARKTQSQSRLSQSQFQGLMPASPPGIWKATLPSSNYNAVSIGRRLRDPLAELVKVEPEHIGVGMYQHDLSPKALREQLDSVVEECVSFVGVDLNAASLHLLQRVSGLNGSRAKAVLGKRTELGGRFESREQLKSVKGLGPKTYQQAAGFLRIYAERSGEESVTKLGKRKAPKGDSPKKKRAKGAKMSAAWTPLDATSVHPESYDNARKLLGALGRSVEDVGALAALGAEEWEEAGRSLGLEPFAIDQLRTALAQPIAHDFRLDGAKAVFRTGIQSLSDLRVGSEVSGVVGNVTHFGAFVDIGVGTAALLHISKFPKPSQGRAIAVGVPLELRVISLEPERKRIGVALK